MADSIFENNIILIRGSLLKDSVYMCTHGQHLKIPDSILLISLYWYDRSHIFAAINILTDWLPLIGNLLIALSFIN